MFTINETDVVIIGGGAAGTMAAIYAHRANPALRLTLLDKSKMETSGAAGRGTASQRPSFMQAPCRCPRQRS